VQKRAHHTSDLTFVAWVQKNYLKWAEFSSIICWV